MDQELSTYLEHMENRIVSALKVHVSEQCEEVESRLKLHVSEQCEKVESRLKLHVSEQCEKVETKLLAEFWKWGRTSDMRTKQAMTDVAIFGERLLAVEDRITALERKRA